MPAIRSCNSFPKTPRRTRIQSTSVSDVTHPNTPESPTLRVEMSRALRRDPSMIFPQQTTLQYGLSFDQTIHDSGSHAGDTSSDAEWKSEVAEIADAPDRPLLYVAGDPVNIKVEENPGDLGIVPIGSLPESSEYILVLICTLMLTCMQSLQLLCSLSQTVLLSIPLKGLKKMVRTSFEEWDVHSLLTFEILLQRSILQLFRPFSHFQFPHHNQKRTCCCNLTASVGPVSPRTNSWLSLSGVMSAAGTWQVGPMNTMTARAYLSWVARILLRRCFFFRFGIDCFCTYCFCTSNYIPLFFSFVTDN